MPQVVFQILAMVIVILLILTLLNWLFSALMIGLKLLMYLAGIGALGFIVYRIFKPVQK